MGVLTLFVWSSFAGSDGVGWMLTGVDLVLLSVNNFSTQGAGWLTMDVGLEGFKARLTSADPWRNEQCSPLLQNPFE